MNNFRILFHGNPIWIKEENCSSPSKAGFYVNFYTTSDSQENAIKKGLEYLNKDEEFLDFFQAVSKIRRK